MKLKHTNLPDYRQTNSRTMHNRTQLMRGDKIPVVEFDSETKSWHVWIEYDGIMKSGTYMVLRPNGAIYSVNKEGRKIAITPIARNVR